MSNLASLSQSGQYWTAKGWFADEDQDGVCHPDALLIYYKATTGQAIETPMLLVAIHTIAWGHVPEHATVIY